jgi:hypothetical protein
MGQTVASAREFGAGPLSRAAALIYNLLVVELLFLLTAGPGLVALLLLERDASNLPLVAVGALPVGPALSAMLFALHHRRHDLTELRPAAAFLRGYRANAGGVLKIWVPLLVWLTIIAMNLAHRSAAGVPGWWAVLLVVVAAAVALVGANALVITSLFAFRARDVARLAAYFVVRTPGVTLANACLALVAVGVVAVASELVLALLVSVFAVATLRGCTPMIVAIEEEFIE